MENGISKVGDIVIFNGEDGSIRVQIDPVNETIWLNQKGIAKLFGCSTDNVGVHLLNIYSDGELSEVATTEISSVVQKEGLRDVSRRIKFYNLDAIIAVGYRVNSKRATAFRIWATKTLREYLVKGYALNDERFKTGQSMNYFKELIERIRTIRLEEKVFYQQIKDIYALSIDYDKNDEKTIKFFKQVQNKLLWAVSGKTAAELKYYRANAELPMMGLTSTEKKGLVKSADTQIGKNYLTQEELNALKLIVEQYLAFAEAQAINHIPMHMDDWITNLNIILTMNRRNVLETAGKISDEMARKKVKGEYEKYKIRQRDMEHLESIKELDKDLKALKIKTPK